MGITLPRTTNPVRYNVANIGVVKEIKYDQLNFLTFENSLMSRKN
jgi:hypothetical protein